MAARLIRWIPATFAVFHLSFAGSADACSNCFGASPYESGLIWSVAFLLPIPFLIAGALGAWIYRISQRDG